MGATIWKLLYGSEILVSTLILSVWLTATTCPTSVESVPVAFDAGSNYDQLASLVREYLKIMDKMRQQPKVISGQVNLRAPRSELMGDMAHQLKLYQLQELDRTYGSKSRPRFGKRNDMTQEDVPLNYGYETYPNNNPAFLSSAAGDEPNQRR